MRFHILARDIQRHDAVGNFCRQMALLFQSKGVEVRLAAENCHPDDRSNIRPMLPAILEIMPGDVVFLHFSTEDPTLPTLAAIQNPKVIFFHNITPERFFLPDEPRSACVVRQGLAQRPFAEKFDVLMANSRVSAHDLHVGLSSEARQRIPESEIKVCPPIIGLDRWSRVARVAVPTPAVDRLVLFVGRLQPHKKVHDLIHGFARLAETDSSVGLAIVGSWADKTYRHRLISAVNALQPDIVRRIVFLQNIPDGSLKYLFEQASVFVTMSAHEGFCVPLVDAMIFNKPLVISTDKGMMETAGSAAVVVSTPAPDHVAAAIASALNDRSVASRLAAARNFRLAELSQLANGRTVLEAAATARKIKGYRGDSNDVLLQC